jgi:peptide/nickel transport system substrate-binding protein
MRLKRSVATLGVAGLMALAACGGGSGGGGGGEQPETDTGTQGEAGGGQDPDAEAPAPAIEGAAEGGTVNVLSALGEQTLDPTEAYFVSSTSVLTGLVTRSLTQFVYRDGEMVLIPDLATDLGTPNDDFTEWTFELREGIKWEDGSDVTPEDWIFGIERSFDNFAEGAFPNGATYSKEYFLNGDTFNGPYSDPDGSCECVTVEDNKLTIKMARPFPDMPYWGMFPAMGPIPAKIKGQDPADYALHPWSTGPYMFDGKINVGRSFKLVRNENWDPETDPGRTAYPDAWDFKVDYGDPAVMERLLLNDSGVGRTGLTPDNVTAPNMAAARDSGRLVTGSNPCTYFYYMDMRKPMWQDINVRKAFALALPVQEGWLARGSTPGVTRIPGTTILPPGIPGRKEFDALGTGGDTPDPEQARQLLEEADAVGTKFKFSYSTEDPLRVDEKNAMVKGWKEAGFDPQPVAVSTTTDNTSMQQDPESGLDVNSLGWCSDWPSGSSWFPPVFSSDGSSNYAYLRDKELDARMDEIQTLPLEEQPAAWGDMDEQIMTEIVPVAHYGYGGVAMLHGSAIQGMENDNVLGQPTFKDIWLQE